jgi:hypothetical protein
MALGQQIMNAIAVGSKIALTVWLSVWIYAGVHPATDVVAIRNVLSNRSVVASIAQPSTSRLGDGFNLEETEHRAEGFAKNKAEIDDLSRRVSNLEALKADVLIARLEERNETDHHLIIGMAFGMIMLGSEKVWGKLFGKVRASSEENSRRRKHFEGEPE